MYNVLFVQTCVCVCVSENESTGVIIYVHRSPMWAACCYTT